MADNAATKKIEVAQAAFRVIAREGVEGASVRAIAHELGSTIGKLTHHFRDKNALLQFLLDRVSDDVTTSVRKALENGNGEAALYELANSFLPTTPSRMRGWRVWLYFYAATLNKADLQREHASRYRNLIEIVAEFLGRMQVDGQFDASFDPEVEANLLICALDGIGVHATMSPSTYPPARQRELAALHISRLLA